MNSNQEHHKRQGEMQNIFMEEALSESHRAIPQCRPNPPVGCIIVYKDKIVARGYTQEPGQAHAEIHALQNLQAQYPEIPLQECTFFVTLEPCSFQGRTPSCAKKLAELNVKEIHVSILDPDPRNNGKGIQILKDAGITVYIGLLEQKVRTYLQPYLMS